MYIYLRRRDNEMIVTVGGKVAYCEKSNGHPDPRRMYPARHFFTAATTATMSSAIFRRQLRSTAPRILRRHVSSTAAVLKPATEATGATSNHPFSSTTHEDLQGVSSMEMLSDSGLSKNPKMRHFTGK